MDFFSIILSSVFMAFFSTNKRNAVNAIIFLILIYSIVLLNDLFLVMYYEWLMIFLSLISIVFARMALKSSFLCSFAYVAHSFVYFLISFEYKIIGNGMLDNAYFYIMYGLLLLLVFSVTYGRMVPVDNIKFRANNFMP